MFLSGSLFGSLERIDYIKCFKSHYFLINMQVQVAPPLAGVPLQSWVHFILKVMVEAFEETPCPGIKVPFFFFN